MNKFTDTLNSLGNIDIPDKKPELEIQNIKTAKEAIVTVKKTQSTVTSPIWLSVSETAKLGGVTTKTIRRALSAKILTYKIVKNRYLIDWQSMLEFLFSNKKLKNKLEQKGIGQYIEKWK